MTQVEFTPSPRILRGLDQIASYLQISRRTAYRWIQGNSLPAMQTPAGTYLTSTGLIDLWILACYHLQRGIQVEETSETGTPSTSSSLEGSG